MEEPESYITDNGNKFWYLPSKGENYWHRLDGPAYEGADGTKVWYVDDKRQRLDGPAYEGADGTKSWWVDDKRHRLDGPALEHADGTKFWWVDGKLLPNEKIEAWFKENYLSINDLKTEEGQMAFKLRWV